VANPAWVRTAARAAFLGSFDSGGEVPAWRLSPPPALIGKSATDLEDLLPAEVERRVPLLAAADAAGAEVSVAELRIPVGRGKVPAVAAFGLPTEAYAASPGLRAAVAATARYMAESPKILAVHPNTSAGKAAGSRSTSPAGRRPQPAARARDRGRGGDGVRRVAVVGPGHARARRDH
jgi:hypothetical protein